MKRQLLLCLLLGVARSQQPVPAPPEGGLNVDQLLDGMVGLIETSVRRAATVSLADFSQRLDSAHQILSNVLSRLGRMQQALDASSSQQESMQQALDGVLSRHESMQQAIEGVSSRQESMQQASEGISSRHQDMQQSLDGVSSRQESVQKALDGVSNRHKSMQQALDGVSVRQESMQQALDGVSSRQDSMQQALDAVSNRQESIQQAVDNVSSRQESMQLAVDDVSSRQKSMQKAVDSVSSWQESTQQTLDAFSSWQQSMQQSFDASFSRQENMQQVLNASSSWQGRMQEMLEDMSDQQSIPWIPANVSIWQLEVDQTVECIGDDIDLLPQRTLGDACSNDSDCSGAVQHSECGASGTCACPNGLLTIGDNACRHPRLTEACAEDSHCQVVTAHAVCSDLVCSCPADYWTRNNTECRRGVGEGQACTYDEDCSTYRSNFTCTAGLCAERVCEAVLRGSFEYRLAGGEACDKGRVEMRRKGGDWSLVCTDGWNNDDAGVICRLLGFRSGASQCCSRFGNNGQNSTYLLLRRCSGLEDSLVRCGLMDWGLEGCSLKEAAGVACN